MNFNLPDMHQWSDFGEFMVCPHCGVADEETVDYPHHRLGHDGDYTDVECSSCGVRFDVTISVEYSYATRIPEGM